MQSGKSGRPVDVVGCGIRANMKQVPLESLKNILHIGRLTHGKVIFTGGMFQILRDFSY